MRGELADLEEGRSRVDEAANTVARQQLSPDKTWSSGSLRVANGEFLPLRQDQLTITGQAMEVRLYAEDPARDYMPSIGTLHHLHQTI